MKLSKTRHIPYEKRIPVWHWICADRTTGKGGLKVEVGQTLSVEGNLELCRSGLHGCRRALDALSYAPGPVACQCELWGRVIEGKNKLCASHRKCIAMIDATTVLHEFACLCAERALTREREMGREPDPRSWAAISAKRKWLQGEIDDDKLAAARAAAWAATGDAAWVAAASAAGDAAWSAAWAAAGDAACAAAMDAVRYAAWAAARAAAASAPVGVSWAAARDAERDWQNAELTRMLTEAMSRGA